MRYVNSILLFRLLNVLLLLWLLLQLGSLFEQLSHWRTYFRSLHENTENTKPEAAEFAAADHQQEGDDDNDMLLTPLASGTLRSEAIRLNELFARPQHKCTDRRVLGGDHGDSFFVCFDRTAKDGGSEGQQGGNSFENALTISGTVRKKLSNAKNNEEKKYFELALNVSTWHVLVPKRDEFVEQLQSDVVLQFMPELEEEGHFPRDRIANTLNGQVFGLAKLEMDSELLATGGRNGDGGERKTERRIALLHWILSRIHTKQLLLVFKPGLDSGRRPSAEKSTWKGNNRAEEEEEEKEASVPLLAWYRFMFAIYFRWHFALLGARSNGRCGQAMQPYDARHCEWRLSFVHFDDFWAAVDVPAYGIGSPLEEKLRFRRYMLTTANGPKPKKELEKRNCRIEFDDDAVPSIAAASAYHEMAHLDLLLPLVTCSKEAAKVPYFHLLVYFRYRPFPNDADAVDAQLEHLLTRTERMALFCSEHFLARNKSSTNHNNNNNEKVQLFNAGIATHSRDQLFMPFPESPSSFTHLPLRPLAELLAQIPVRAYQRNALLLDLDGAEWDVLGTSIVANQQICEKWLRSFELISMRLRIWAMEESENWRRFYLWFLRLEECQFQKVFARGIGRHIILVVYRRKKIVVDAGK